MLPVQRAPIRLPRTGSGGENPFDNDSGGGTSGGPIDWQQDPKTGLWYDPATGKQAPEYVQNQLNSGGGAADYGYQYPDTMVGAPVTADSAIEAINSGNYTSADVRAVKDAGLITATQAAKLLSGVGTGSASGGVGSDPYAASREARAAAGFAADEEQRRISNALTWQDLLNSQKYADRNFAQGQLQDNRTEMGNRAQSGYSLGNLLMDISTRDDALANDPGNFPAWLTANQNSTALGPTVQNLVGEGVSINPQNTGRGIDDPRFTSVLDTLFDYSKVPSAGDVDRTQQAYNTDPAAAQRWFEAADALDKSKGMATGGVMQINRPMRLQDLTTGETAGVVGENGAETMAVAPNANGGVSYNDPRIGSAGTFGALAKALRAGNMYSAIPRDVIDGMAGGMAPQPGAIPDWILAKLPPSLRQMLVAGVRSQLGQSGLEDWDWTRSLYEPKGFNSLAGGIAR